MGKKTKQKFEVQTDRQIRIQNTDRETHWKPSVIQVLPPLLNIRQPETAVTLQSSQTEGEKQQTSQTEGAQPKWRERGDEEVAHLA